ncbi:MAG: luciferase-like monooxygenase superfamily protein [Candidatus Binatia bacterium]|nr:MAG: luciferase-like monooxygenase superfamily protein [Candidatus Binatia bacterium]
MELAIQVGGGQVRRDKTGIEAIVEQARLAEDLGFRVVFVPDHYVFESLGVLQKDIPAYEMSFVMATLAQRTRTIRIGSHVACVLFRHPAMLARLFAQIDEASGGRLLAGVGAGWTKAEFEMMGIDFPPPSVRLEMLDETVEILFGLWTRETFTFEGKHYRLREAVCLPKPAQKPRPPLMLGGSGKGILARAGRYADIVHMVPTLGTAGTTTLEEVRKFTDRAVTSKLARVREAEEKAGRPKGSVRFATTIFQYTMTSSPAETKRLAEELSGVFGLSPGELLQHPVSLLGTAEEMVDELRRREETHGLSLLAINFTEDSQIRTFGEKVLPKVSS